MAQKPFALETSKSGLPFHNLSKILHLLLSLKTNKILVWRKLPLPVMPNFYRNLIRLHLILTFFVLLWWTFHCKFSVFTILTTIRTMYIVIF